MTKDKTLIFVFSWDLEKVYLIRKKKPKWQEDFLNGVGGKVEKEESFDDCAIRETKEEINIDIDKHKLQNLGVIEAKDFRVRIYAYRTKQKPKQMEDEELKITPVKSIPNLNVIPNLRMLVPYAQYVLKGEDINVREYIQSTLIIKFK